MWPFCYHQALKVQSKTQLVVLFLQKFEMIIMNNWIYNRGKDILKKCNIRIFCAGLDIEYNTLYLQIAEPYKKLGNIWKC